MSRLAVRTPLVLLLLAGAGTGPGPPAPEAAGPGPSPSVAARPAASRSAPFAVRYRGRESRRRVNPAFLMPGETLELEAVAGPRSARLRVRAPAGGLTRSGGGRWRWTAPREPGYVPLEIADPATGERVTVAAFVMVPMERAADGRLHGYRIGAYPEKPFRGLERYRRPQGLVRVTPENRDLLVSPRFRLGQFLCKQPGGFPKYVKYVVLSERLPWKLEAIVDELERRGIRASGLHVMSGYRSPAYNAALGQGRYSRHVYGDAADVFVDERPRDGRMDDLNGDGRVDLADARVLAAAVEADPRLSPPGPGSPGRRAGAGGRRRREGGCPPPRRPRAR